MKILPLHCAIQWTFWFSAIQKKGSCIMPHNTIYAIQNTSSFTMFVVPLCDTVNRVWLFRRMILWLRGAMFDVVSSDHFHSFHSSLLHFHVDNRVVHLFILASDLRSTTCLLSFACPNSFCFLLSVVMLIPSDKAILAFSCILFERHRLFISFVYRPLMIFIVIPAIKWWIWLTLSFCCRQWFHFGDP